MAILITYADKVTDVVSPLPAEKKLTAADATEIKDVTNANATELTNRPSKVQNSNNTFDEDTGAADAYVITLSPAITSYVKGQLFSFEAINANLTTTPTIDVNGQGAQTIINRDGTALSPGDIPANSNNIIQYDGTNFQLLTSSGAAWVPSLTTGDATAIQNTTASDITAQTGTKTFTFLDSTIDVTGRTSTGEVNFLHFKKTDTGTLSVFKVNSDGQITVIDGTAAAPGIVFIANTNTGFRQVSNRVETIINATVITAVTSAGLQPLNDNLRDSGTVGLSWRTTFTHRLALRLTTGDVASPLEGEIWYNNTTNKYRGNQGGGAIDLIGGGGNVTKVGTPVNNQLGIWTGDGTIEGDSNVTWDNSSFIIKNAALRQLIYNNGTGTLSLTQTVAGDSQILDIKNEVTNVANDASINIAVNAGGGDAYTSYSDVGTFSFAMGVDNSDSDFFKITSSTTVLATPSIGTEIMAFSPAGGWALFGVAPATQQAHVADATDAASAITQLNLLLAQFATYGLQAAS